MPYNNKRHLNVKPINEVDGKSGEFKVVSKSGAVITLIEVNLPTKRLKNLSIGKAKLEQNMQYIKQQEQIADIELQLKLQTTVMKKAIDELKQVIGQLLEQNETLAQDLENMSKHVTKHHDVLSLLDISKQNGRIIIKSSEWQSGTALAIEPHQITIGNPNTEHIILKF